MTEKDYDLVIVGAGSGGLTAAGFAARLGAKVALAEKHRIGGDCTWTGCVPSKALLKAAKVAHEVRTASHYGIRANQPAADMEKVREYVQSAIQQVYQFERPEELERQGVDVIVGGARFQLASGLIFAFAAPFCYTAFILLGERAMSSVPAVAASATMMRLFIGRVLSSFDRRLH